MYNKLIINIVVRVLLLLIVSFLICFLIIKTSRYFTIILFSMVFTFLIFEFIHYSSNIRKYLNSFFHYIHDNVGNSSYNLDKIHSLFPDLVTHFNQIIKLIASARIDKENHLQFLKHITDHVDTAIIALNENQSILFSNSAALEIFEISKLSSLSVFSYIKPNFDVELFSLKSGQHKLFDLNLKGKKNVFQLNAQSSNPWKAT